MTVSVINNRVQYTGNGSLVTYAYAFKAYEDADLEVYVEGVLQTLTTHYTVTGAGDSGGGNVVFVTPPANGVKVTIIRTLPLTQQTDYTAYDAFPAETHEDGLDRLTYISQQLLEGLGRSMQLDPTSPITFPPFVIPELAANRENKLVTFSADGTQLEVGSEIGTWKGDWVTATGYSKRDFFKDATNGDIYYVLADHTSSAIASDVSGGNIELLINVDAMAATIGYAAEWANKAENSLVSAAAGGDELDDYSALHWAAKALASAIAAATSESNGAASASAAATSASNAATSAGAAAASASAASASETNSFTSEGNAGTSESNAAASAASAAASASAGMYKDVTVVAFADSPYTVTEGQTGDLLWVDTSGGNVVINLPSLSAASADFRMGVAKTTVDANTITVQRQGTDTINGGTSHAIDNQWEKYNYVGDKSAGVYLAAGGLGEGTAGWNVSSVASGTIIPADYSGKAPLTRISGAVTCQLSNTPTVGMVYSYLIVTGGSLTIDETTNTQTLLLPPDKTDAHRGVGSIVSLTKTAANEWLAYGDLLDA